MSSLPRPCGIYSAQWLPTDARGRLDRAALAETFAFERQRGIDGVLVLGSTGEFPYFSPAERAEVLRVLAELAAPLPIIANVTDVRPKVAIELGREARSLGFAAVALMPPMFYPFSQPDLLAYFLHVAEGAGLPVLLYNYPEVTGKRIEVETVAAFAERAPLAGIKQSGRDFDYHKALIRLAREKKFSVMTGFDTRLPDVYALGADGCIGGMVNFVPELMVHLDRVCRLKQPGEVNPADARLKEVSAIIDRLTFPLNVAAGMEARGLPIGAPKAVVSADSKRIFGEVVLELRERFRAWNLELAGEAVGLT